MSTSARLLYACRVACRVESNDTSPDRPDDMRVEVTLGDLRRLLAVLDAATWLVLRTRPDAEAPSTEENAAQAFRTLRVAVAECSR